MPRPVRSADIAELRAFCAAIDLGSLGRAARLLRVSQPALSKRLKTLEALAGARLLERSSRGVRATPAGTRLYVEARKLLVQAEAIDELLSATHEEESPVRVAASHTVAEFVLPRALVELEARRERHLSVELVIANSLVVRDVVRDGRADLGIAAGEPGLGPDPALSETHLMDDEVIVGVPAGHPWMALETVELEDFVRAPMVARDPGANTRRVVEAVLAERGLALAPPLAEVGSTSAAKAAALSEGAPVLLSRLALGQQDRELFVRTVRDVRFARRFVLLQAAERTLSPSARALHEHLRVAAGSGGS